MSSVRKKPSSVSNENGYLVVNNSNESVNSSTPSKSQSSKSIYQTPKITAGAVIKPQYINTQDFNSNSKQQYISPNVVPSPFDYQYGSYLLPSNLMTPYTANLHKKSNSSYFGDAESSFNTNIDDTFENINEEKKRTNSGNNSMFFQPPTRPSISMRTSSSSSTMFNLSNKVFSNHSTRDDMPLSSTSSRHSVAIENMTFGRVPYENDVVHVTKMEGLNSSFKLKCNYSYTFTSTSSFNSIIFSNLNDKLTLEMFLSNIDILEPFGKVAIKEAFKFKIVKDGRKDINTILLNFYTQNALQYFIDKFVADLVKYKKLFNSNHLILRKCHLESTILSNVKDDALKLEIGNRLQFMTEGDPSTSPFIRYTNYEDDEDDNREIILSDRFLLVDTLDIDLILRILTLKPCEDTEELNEQVFLKVQKIYKIRNPIYKNEDSSEHALLLAFDSGNIKQLAVHLFGCHNGDEDISIYDVKRLHIKNPKAQIIEDDTLEIELDKEDNVSKTHTKAQYIKVLKNDGHLQVNAFSHEVYNKDNIDLKYENVSFLSHHQRIIFKRKPANLQGVDHMTCGTENMNNDDVGPINDPFQSSVLGGSNTPSDISKTTSLSGFIPHVEVDPHFRKINYTNRLIFLANLPPVVKIFDLVNVIRGGLIEQIRFSQGSKYCFVKFVLPSSANLFYDCCKLRPIVLHGFQLDVDFGKKGLELPPVSPNLMMKISLGATRNVYLSLPEFSYKKIYTTDKRYMKYQQFKLPSPEDIMADFGRKFGPLEQINFAKDNHCCWINFMSIHAAIKLMKALENDADKFHESFENKYLGLVFKYGKDRCAKLPKDVYE
ncbi:hypothetical protein ACO0R3_000661 [Hanseniaspora guilliermondii]